LYLLFLLLHLFLLRCYLNVLLSLLDYRQMRMLSSFAVLPTLALVASVL
jgi:hypothetical protein